jgi:hypothetical protein
MTPTYPARRGLKEESTWKTVFPYLISPNLAPQTPTYIPHHPVDAARLNHLAFVIDITDVEESALQLDPLF